MKPALMTSGMLSLAMMVSCGKPQTAKLSEHWNWENDPQQMDSEFVRERAYEDRFAALPKSGQLSNTPWSGDYWPTFKGGIAYRWNWRGEDNFRRGYPLLNVRQLDQETLRYLSPAEKYDLYLGHTEFPLTRRERARTKVLKTIPELPEYDERLKIPYWEGLCHAWAVAALGFEEPQPVLVTIPRGPLRGMRLPFGSGDIKALLTYFLHEVPAHTQYLGQRCDVELEDLEKQHREGTITLADYHAQRQACLDTNAGAFHLVLANQIGLLDEGFIFDVTKGAEVWNHPVSAYHSEVLEERNGASPGAANGTVRELLVKTTVTYTVELQSTWRVNSEINLVDREYIYRLELNSRGAIIGGAWPQDSDDRPDFLWKSALPEFTGRWAPLEYLYLQALGK